jgi:hypothetical protein
MVAAVAVVVVIVVVGVEVVVVAIDLVIDEVAADKRASMLLAGSDEKISRRHRWWPCCPQVVHIVDVLAIDIDSISHRTLSRTNKKIRMQPGRYTYSTSSSDLFLDSSVAREFTEIGASSGS